MKMILLRIITAHTESCTHRLRDYNSCSPFYQAAFVKAMFTVMLCTLWSINNLNLKLNL